MKKDCAVDIDDFMARIEGGMESDFKWRGQARRLLKAEIARSRLSYRTLAQRLTDMGYACSELTLREKIEHDGVSATLLAQCLVALGLRSIRLN